MNLPFKRNNTEKEVRKVAPTVPPTKLITSASILAELVPPMPERYQTETEEECAINGFFEGLNEVGFGVEDLAMMIGIKERLMEKGYEMPDPIWKKVNKLTFKQQARVIYVMVRYVHAWNALRAKKPGYLCLPLELSGEDNFLSILARLKPLLRRLGLDKGKTEANGLEYPTVINMFLDVRIDLFRVYQLEDYLALEDFILQNPLDYWPKELAEKFCDSRTLIDATREACEHFMSAKLHPKLRA